MELSHGCPAPTREDCLTLLKKTATDISMSETNDRDRKGPETTLASQGQQPEQEWETQGALHVGGSESNQDLRSLQDELLKLGSRSLSPAGGTADLLPATVGDVPLMGSQLEMLHAAEAGEKELLGMALAAVAVEKLAAPEVAPAVGFAGTGIPAPAPVPLRAVDFLVVACQRPGALNNPLTLAADEGLFAGQPVFRALAR